MLGTVKNQNSWRWCASGKHPVAGDYLRLGAQDTFLKAFIDWMDAGYRHLGRRDGKNITRQNSWRFWAKAPLKKHLICGVGKDSCDSMGRSYPLVIMGIGPLKKWELSWELLPFVLETTWNHIEYLSAKRFQDFKQLQDDVQKIPAPVDDWPEVGTMPEFSNNNMPWTSAISSDRRETVKKQTDQGEWFFPVNNHELENPFIILNRWHYSLKQRFKIPPNIVFMGGIPQKTCLALYNRPLRPDDFVKLWSTCSEDIKRNGR